MSHEVFTDAQLFGPKNVMGYPELSSKSFSLESQVLQQTNQNQASGAEFPQVHRKTHKKHK